MSFKEHTVSRLLLSRLQTEELLWKVYLYGFGVVLYCGIGPNIWRVGRMNFKDHIVSKFLLCHLQIEEQLWETYSSSFDIVAL